MTREAVRERIEVLDHAVERFVERVRPGSEPARARAELARLLAIADFVFEAPDWLASRARQQAPMYAVVGDLVSAAAARARRRVARRGHLLDARWPQRPCPPTPQREAKPTQQPGA